jgi:hypothetical protein
LVNFINKATFLKNGKKVNINPQAGLRAKQPRLKRTPKQAWGDINPQAGLGAKQPQLNNPEAGFGANQSRISREICAIRS